MLRTPRLLLLLAGLAAALAIPTAAGAQSPRTAVVTLSAATSRDDPRGGVNGTATLTDMGDGRTQVVLRVANPTSDNMPAHFHTGRCPDVGAVIYPLNNLQGGTSTSVINTTIADLLAGRGAPDEMYAINLHRSVQEASAYVSCGNVVAANLQLPRTGSRGVPFAPVLAGASALLAGVAAFALRRRVA